MVFKVICQKYQDPLCHVVFKVYAISTKIEICQCGVKSYNLFDKYQDHNMSMWCLKLYAISTKITICQCSV